jgi:hypothetical protein
MLIVRLIVPSLVLKAVKTLIVSFEGGVVAGVVSVMLFIPFSDGGFDPRNSAALVPCYPNQGSDPDQGQPVDQVLEPLFGMPATGCLLTHIASQFGCKIVRFGHITRCNRGS